jgi:hypothetical protein
MRGVFLLGGGKMTVTLIAWIVTVTLIIFLKKIAKNVKIRLTKILTGFIFFIAAFWNAEINQTREN